VIDLRLLRDDPDYRAGALKKGTSEPELDELLALDGRRRASQTVVEQLRAEANAASREIAKVAADERAAMIARAGDLKARLNAAEAELAELGGALNELLLAIPNPAHPSVPAGGEDDFEVVATWGTPSAAPRLDHADYGAAMGWVETEQAARNMGSRFAYVKGAAVLLEFALVQWVLGRLVAQGFEPVVPPVLVREDLLVEAGFFPTDRNQVYALPEDELFLIGTSEVALAALHRRERLDGPLPRRYAGFSTCFRREAGTYGKDTRGIFRVHQFDKVEMFSYCHPDRSWEELEVLRAFEEATFQGLELPYRVIAVAGGDLGNPAAKKYDCEVWLPSEGRYREATSCSNYTDYSARRLGTRYRDDTGTGLVHTLNGTACAIGRTLVFMMEHCQQPDGSFVVPAVLRPFSGLEVIEPA
jgi:seryl-tRNA synthetase